MADCVAGVGAACHSGVVDEPRDRWKHLPEPVSLEDTRETYDVEPVPDPTVGRDTERDFMLRWS
jgi:hypothetical protein